MVAGASEDDSECHGVRSTVGSLDGQFQDPPPGHRETNPGDLVDAGTVGRRDPWPGGLPVVMHRPPAGNFDRSVLNGAPVLIGDLDRPGVEPPDRNGKDVAGNVNVEQSLVARSPQGGGMIPDGHCSTRRRQAEYRGGKCPQALAEAPFGTWSLFVPHHASPFELRASRWFLLMGMGFRVIGQ